MCFLMILIIFTIMLERPIYAMLNNTLGEQKVFARKSV